MLKRLIDNEPWFVAAIAIVCRACNIKTAAVFANWLAPKNGALFSLIYFFGSFCVYYILHNYVIPQAMPHFIPQIHSSFYPHRFSVETFSIRQTANRTLQLRVAEISNVSKAFSSRIHIGIVRLQGSPEETRRLSEAWAPQSQRNKQNKMKFTEWYVKNRN